MIIRLLNLLPGCQGDALKCTISHHSLADQPSYQALSYVWGSQDEQHIVECQGRFLTVGPNLYAALCRLRQMDHERVLWVDKLCICQVDINERGHQVSLMGDIFSIAISVIVWMGEGTPADSVAFTMLKKIDEAVLKRERERLWLRSSSQFMPQSFFTYEKLVSVRNLLTNTWFLPAWTFQEAVFAKSILTRCGANSMPWNTLSECLRWLLTSDALHNRIPEQFSAVKSSANLFRDITDTRGHFEAERMKNVGVNFIRKSVHELLVTRRSTNATDPRDRVFALVNVSSDKLNVGNHRYYSWVNQLDFAFHEPNYNMSVEQVYIATARHIITVEKKLDILLQVDVPKADTGMPSWVPDWREPLRDSGRLSILTRYRRGFSETSGTWTELKDHHPTKPQREHEGRIAVNDPERLTIKGCRGARIGAVGERCPRPDTAQLSQYLDVVGNQGTWGSMARRCSTKGVYAPTHKEIDLEYAFVTLDRWFTISGWNDPRNYSEADSLDIYERCGHRKFFTTENGYFGLGPVTTKVGDMTYLLLGGDVPFILRPATANTKTLVGGAYVHGLMHAVGHLRVWQRYQLEDELSRTAQGSEQLDQGRVEYLSRLGIHAPEWVTLV